MILNYYRMEEEQNPICGTGMLKYLLRLRHKKDEEERQTQKKDPIVVSGILANHLLECPQEEFEEWLRTHTDDDDKLDIYEQQRQQTSSNMRMGDVPENAQESRREEGSETEKARI